MRRSLLLLPVFLLAGCGEEPQPATPAPAPAALPKTQLERDINVTGAASAVGYDGDAIKQDIQKTVDAQQEQNRKAAEAAQGSDGQ